MNANGVVVRDVLNESGGVDEIVDVMRDFNPRQALLTSVNHRSVYKLEREAAYFSWSAMAFIVRYRVSYSA